MSLVEQLLAGEATAIDLSLHSLEDLRHNSSELESRIQSLSKKIDSLESADLLELQARHQLLCKDRESLEKQSQMLETLSKVPHSGLESMPIIPAYAPAMEAKFAIKLKAVDKQISSIEGEEQSEAFVEKHIVLLANDMLAGEKSFEMEELDKVKVSKRAASFYGELVNAKPHVSSGSSSLAKAASEFLLHCKQHYASELQDMPQQAALFCNDCQLFARHASELSPAKHESYATVWKNLGSQVLEAVLKQQKDELRKALEDLEPAWSGAAIDFPRLEAGAKAVGERLRLVSSQWSPILQESLHYHAPLYIGVVEWYWSHLVSLPDIGIDECDGLHDLGQTLVALSLDLALFDVVLENASFRKLSAFTPVLKMNLMQLSNAYRRKKIVPPLTAGELSHAVRAMFADSEGRQAFIAELEED